MDPTSEPNFNPDTHRSSGERSQPPQISRRSASPVPPPAEPTVRNPFTSLRPPSVSAPQPADAVAVAPAEPTSAASSDAGGGFYFLLTMMCTVAVAWFIGPRLVEEYYYAATIGQARGEYENAVTQLESKPLTEVSLAYQMVAQRIRPSVVSIRAHKAKDVGFGSGVILSSNGYLMSNAHVIENSQEVEVELFDRRRYKADLIGIDPDSDLAVLKIHADNLIPATWGDSDAIQVGSMVWAIGSPYEFQQTITSGILSGKNRRGDAHHTKQTLLQTDAAVNPGNSGGPLVDAQGQVIGINTSIFGETFQGISFAVPSSTAQFVFEQLVDDNVVTRGYLGIEPLEVTERFANDFRLPDLEGAVVNRVQPGSPAHLAGIRQADIVRRWNGKPVRNFRQLFRFAEASKPGTQVQIDLWRPTADRQSKTEESVMVTMQALPQFEQRPPSKFSRER